MITRIFNFASRYVVFVGEWLLAGGIWNDDGVWDDNENWED